MKKLFVCLIMSLSAILPTASAGMWWLRGDEGSTWQEWLFLTDANPAIAEDYFNPYGNPTATIITEESVHSDPPGWYEDYLGREGVWHGNFTSISLTIPNTDIPNDFKEVWVEVGFRGELLPNPAYPDYDETYAPLLTAWIDGMAIEQGNIVELERIIENVGSGWRKLMIGWRIYPNPDVEEIYLAFHNSGADIDYVIVDTICIPEPATLALLGLGAILLRKRK